MILTPEDFSMIKGIKIGCARLEIDYDTSKKPGGIRRIWGENAKFWDWFKCEADVAIWDLCQWLKEMERGNKGTGLHVADNQENGKHKDVVSLHFLASLECLDNIENFE